MIIGLNEAQISEESMIILKSWIVMANRNLLSLIKMKSQRSGDVHVNVEMSEANYDSTPNDCNELKSLIHCDLSL